MTVAEYAAILRRNLVWIVVLMLVCGGVSYGYAQTLPKQYRSYSSVIVVPERGENTSEIVQGSNYVQNIVQSYALLATTPYVLQPVIDDLGLDKSPGALSREIAVETPLNTVVIQLSVTATSPKEAQQIAGAVADSLIKAVSELSPKIGNQPAVYLETISPASLPTTYVFPDNRLYAAIGAAVGLAIALVIAFLREQLRSRPRNRDDIGEFTDLPVLGEVPRVPRDAMTVPEAVLRAPDGHIAESMRAIAASLRFVSVDKPAKVILVTSARPSDGKSSVSTALGITFAEAGLRTLVIDADLRNPSIADMIGVEAEVGLTTVLVHDADLTEAVQHWGHENLRVLASGPLSPNPGQLISSGQLSGVISSAREQFDSVIIDTSPTLAVSDALWLAPLTDGVIVVARARKTPIRAIRSALEAVSSTRATVLGLVLNGAQVTADSRYHGRHYAEQWDKTAGSKARRNSRPSSTS